MVDYQNAPYHNDRCMEDRVVPFRARAPGADAPAPSAAALEDRVHWLAKGSANLRFDSPHFQQRLALRKVTMRQVLETLRQGSVIDGPTKDEWGDWRVKLQRRVAGRRVQVVVAVKERHLDVVTVI
jgi:hypothetical protein